MIWFEIFSPGLLKKLPNRLQGIRGKKIVMWVLLSPLTTQDFRFNYVEMERL